MAALLAMTGAAFGWNEVTNVDVYEVEETRPVRTTCASCHQPYSGGTTDAWGVHGGFTNATDKCGQCHTLHDADSARLLPGATITDTCELCHDGTGGEGVYGAILGRMGVAPLADHSTEVTSEIPGGDPVTGGSSFRAFRGLGTTLTCTDCHSAHGRDLVVAFKGDRQRTDWGMDNPTSTKLLRRKPGGVTAPVPEYGSDWCLACHAGRTDGSSEVHNHPVETSATVPPYVYGRLPVLTGAMPTGSTAIGAAGDSNVAYLMPFPRTVGAGGQQGHDPICQQCHEDSRSVGNLTDAGLATATAFQVSVPIWMQPDGWNASDNPRFTTFPHETVNTKMLLEPKDDLCLNCHCLAQWP